MQVTLERDALHAALGRVAKIVERRTTIPILSNLLLRAEAGRLAITGTDLDMVATTILAAEVIVGGATSVPAHLLAEFVGKLPSGAQIRLEQEESRMVVRSGRSRITLNVLAAEDFPDLGPQEMPHAFNLPAGDLVALIGKTEFAISTEETRYYLNGIFLHTMEVEGVRQLRAVATDGHRLARWQMPAPEGSAEMPGIIVPRKAVAELKRLARDLAKDASATIAIRVSDRRLEATLPGKPAAVVFSTKLIDGTFPDYLRVIPVGNTKRVRLPRVPCAAATDRVACISSERGRQIKLALADDKLILTVTNVDAGHAADEIDVGYEAAPIEIGFNAAYLGEVLGTLDGEDVDLALGDPGSPALFTEQADAALLIVLMPMRV